MNLLTITLPLVIIIFIYPNPFVVFIGILLLIAMNNILRKHNVIR